MDDLRLLLIIYAVLVVPTIGWTYLRQRRVSGFLGWSIMILGLLLLLGGGADAVDWGGLLWTFVAFFGGLLIITDLLHQRAQAAAAERERQHGEDANEL